MRVLCYADNPWACGTVTQRLRQRECIVTNPKGPNAFSHASRYRYDVVVLSLGNEGAGEFFVTIKARHLAPYLVVLARNQATLNTLQQLLPSEDIIFLGYGPSRIVERVETIYRAMQGQVDVVVETGPFRINCSARTVAVHGIPFYCTSKEFDLLELLVLNADSTVTLEMIMGRLYAGFHEPSLDTIKVFVHKLRRRLKVALNGAEHVGTVWGRGYVLRTHAPHMPNGSAGAG